ncbi:uncharacterized protein AMSG_08779 [Thecamonas trahens ATCC 50062]|uniref:Uncharacterized protein n=1 Tax=Thecamonas trahens ATCC 50062 TaxID=461836 RepID=A0A0L0DPD6_THETB|nr:hypothetical protein AMSG_08779 [Thecamonas trahens ATCC 50062]KNC53288.1 hypothetical protein AMSG_08779 [Thecamonas trahens ATCC 50062]|eukprot:XP_013754550.1 hypothetical protein AMSG_08779 [Thecamonas trahens ATCC 50062]
MTSTMAATSGVPTAGGGPTLVARASSCVPRTRDAVAPPDDESQIDDDESDSEHPPLTTLSSDAVGVDSDPPPPCSAARPRARSASSARLEVRACHSLELACELSLLLVEPVACSSAARLWAMARRMWSTSGSFSSSRTDDDAGDADDADEPAAPARSS